MENVDGPVLVLAQKEEVQTQQTVDGGSLKLSVKGVAMLADMARVKRRARFERG